MDMVIPIRRVALASAAVFLVVLAVGCSSDSSTDPVATRFTLSGRVRLESRLFDLSGNPTGVRSVEEAEGVPVYLEGTGGIMDSTRTLGGGYSFGHLAPGVYHVLSWVLPAHPIRLADINIVNGDLAEPDTLVLGPMGDMHTSPNPSEPEGFGVEFTANGAQRFAVAILDLRLSVVWSDADTTYGGFNHRHWDGDQLDEQVAPEGAYWAVVHVNGVDAYNLAFWSPGIELPNAGNCGHIVAAGLLLQQDGSTLVTEWHGAQHGNLQAAAGSVERGLQLLFLRADSTAFAIADTCPENRLTWTIADTNLVSVELALGRKWTFDLVGKRAGSTTIVLHAWHQQHIHVNSLPIPVVIAGGVESLGFRLPPPPPGTANRCSARSRHAP